MTGREEKDLRIEAWIKTKLSECPAILKDYMRHIDKKTSMTRKAYLGYLKQFCEFMEEREVKLIEAKPLDLDAYKEYISVTNGHDNAPSIINTKLAAVISFYNFLQMNRMISDNPCEYVEKLNVQGKDEVVYMTEEEQEKLYNNIRTAKHRRTKKYINRDLCIVKLGCSTGLRVSAICNINLDDVDLENGTIWVTEKGDKKVKTRIGQNTISTINTWLKDRERILGDEKQTALFINPHHDRLSTAAVNEMIQKETIDFGKHITPHKMRSSCAMELYDKTGDIYLVQQQLNHANIRNTMIYAKATEQKMSEACALLD